MRISKNIDREHSRCHGNGYCARMRHAKMVNVQCSIFQQKRQLLGKILTLLAC